VRVKTDEGWKDWDEPNFSNQVLRMNLKRIKGKGVWKVNLDTIERYRKPIDDEIAN
jgi:hypothetical protein